MADYDRTQAYNVQAKARAEALGVDEGLRSYMMRVYNYMGVGLLITALVSYVVYSQAITTDASQATGQLQNGILLTAFGKAIYTTWLKWVLVFSPLAVVMLFSARLNSMSATTAQTVFWVFSALVGASISTIFIRYQQQSIAQIFLVTSVGFGALSLWSYTTKRDLSGIATFLWMGLVGLIVASVVNWFIQSSALQFALSAITVLVFAGFTAYDTQKLKDNYYGYASAGGEALGRSAVSGALNLYLDFINIFLALLQLFGDRR